MRRGGGLLIAGALVACGGGGGHRAPAPSPTPAPAAGAHAHAPDCAAAVASLVQASHAPPATTFPPDAQAEIDRVRGEAFAAACRDDHWPGDARACFVLATDADGVTACDTEFRAVAESVRTHLAARAEELHQLMSRPGLGAVGDAPVTTGIAECDAYLADLMRMQSCSKFPAEARESLDQSVKALRASIEAARNDPSQIRTFVSTCVGGAEAIRQAGQAFCN